LGLGHRRLDKRRLEYRRNQESYDTVEKRTSHEF
jgi:hypothetical protein